MPGFFTKEFIYKHVQHAVDNKASIIFWHQAMSNVSYLIKEDNHLWKAEMKRMRKDFKNGTLTMLEGNNRTYKNQFGTWHSMIVQTAEDEKCPHQPLSLLAFGTMVCGLPYYFKNKRDRDLAYNYLTK